MYYKTQKVISVQMPVYFKKPIQEHPDGDMNRGFHTIDTKKNTALTFKVIKV